MGNKRWLVGILTMGIVVTAGAQSMMAPDAGQKTADTTAGDPVLDAAAQEIGRALFLRCMCAGETLRFNASGRMADDVKSKPVDWTLAGVNVKKVERKDAETVQLDGVRVAVLWSDATHEFSRRELKNQPVHILLAGNADRAGAERTLRAVFSLGMDHAFERATPPYWQHYFFPQMAWPKDALDNVSIARAGTKINGVEVPVPVLRKKLTAEYTIEAAQDHIQGPSILQVVVDEQGASHRVSIAQPLGYGLDAAAVQALEKSTFAPSVVNGKSAAVVFFAKENFSVQPPPGN